MDYSFIKAENASGLTDDQIREQVRSWLSRYPSLKKILILPPDITRLNSYAGPITKMICDLLPDTVIDIMPALGTHVPLTGEEMDKMFPGVPHAWFHPHNWRTDVAHIGDVPAEYVDSVSEGWMKESIRVEINKRLLDPSYDLILSVGQVVPHEVVGMANYNKNIFVGCGGSSIINASHYLGALYGMENMMGRDHTPVHKVFDYAEEHFCAFLPLVYILTVTDPDETGPNVRSLAIGRSRDMFSESIKVSQNCNLNFLDEPLKKVVVFLDPEEFRTTWLGNKSVYRTRMAIADNGELIVIAPGVHRFGEDLTNDALIRRYGYVGRKKILDCVEKNKDLADNLSVAAHLIHGSSDGRFTITYAPGHLTREETESVGFRYRPLEEVTKLYDVNALKNGFNVVNGEEIYYISNPALGLWACRKHFQQ